MGISLVIPAYNSADILSKSVKKIHKKLELIDKDFEIIIAEDGSTDGSDLIASKLSKELENVRYLHSPKRKGKGKAIKDALNSARFDILAFMDVDLSTDISCFPKLIEIVKDGADIAIGSRNLKESKIERGLKREVISKSYSTLVRLLFRTRIKDFQCGFKAFRRSVLPIFLRARDDEFFWDTEVLILAERKKLKIVEMPVVWKEYKKTKINLLKYPFKMFLSMVRFRINLND